MSEITKLALLSISMFGMCITTFTLGFHIIKCKPVLALPNLRSIACLICTPMIILGILAIVEILTADTGQAFLPQAKEEIFLIATFTLPILLVPHGYWLFNITNDIQLESLCQALDKQGIKFSTQKNTRDIAVTAIVLDGIDSEIRVKTMAQGQGWIHIKRKKLISNYSTLIADFKENLASHQCELSVLYGVRFLFMAPIIGGGMIYFIFQYFN